MILHAPVAAVLVLALAGCGGARDTTSSGRPPYDGPMVVEPDRSDRATVLERSGAAGLALECEGAPYDGGGGDYVDGGLESVQASAEEALVDFGRHTTMAVPPEDFVVERAEGDRVLFSYDVEGATRVAAVAADGITDFDDETGWGIEAWAQCDPAELPDAVAEASGHAVWTDAEGHPVPVTTVTSFRGPEHCDWQATTFLTLGVYDGRAYLGKPDGHLERRLTTTYQARSSLPDDASDTGYERDGRRLWLGTDPRAAYLVRTTDPEDVERWPWTTEEIWCA